MQPIYLKPTKKDMEKPKTRELEPEEGVLELLISG